tara:strand:- start:169 stop:1104 length:936 start_codon:yes stop_codon:yes gene_type:complete
MNTKTKKLLLEYSRNSRITTKELGRKIGSSQQSASYLLKSLKKKKVITGETTVVDAVKLGYVNVIVGFNFLNTSAKKEVIDELMGISSITSIEEGKEGVDLLVEYTAQNLSAFNKIHSEIIYRFFKKLRSQFVFPLIVSHNYDKNYLSRKFYDSDVILFGDRTLRELSGNEVNVMHELVRNSGKKLIDISESLDLPVKTVVRVKRALESKYIIRSYSSIVNHNKIGIARQIIFLRFSSEGIRGIDKFSEYAFRNKNIIKFSKIIGRFQMALTVESLKDIEILKDIRSNFSIDDYLIIKSDKVHKKVYLPLE